MGMTTPIFGAVTLYTAEGTIPQQHPGSLSMNTLILSELLGCPEAIVSALMIFSKR